MIDLIKKPLIDFLEKNGISNPNVHLEHPENIIHGDFSTNIAMIYAKSLKMSPMALAGKIVEEYKKNQPKEITAIEIAGSGFINF
ncbi:MAG: arginine--tRNA ligase, partial [Patescibacteria group bacterium]